MAWALFRRDNSRAAVEAHLKRILFLMDFLQGHINRDKASVIAALNEGLLMRIPTDIHDPEGRTYPDPADESLSIAFNCHDHERPTRANQFLIHGYEDIAYALIIGTGHDPADRSISWSFSQLRGQTPTPPGTAQLEKLFWAAPGWKLLDVRFGQHRIRSISKE